MTPYISKAFWFLAGYVVSDVWNGVLELFNNWGFDQELQRQQFAHLENTVEQLKHHVWSAIANLRKEK